MQIGYVAVYLGTSLSEFPDLNHTSKLLILVSFTMETPTVKLASNVRELRNQAMRAYSAQRPATRKTVSVRFENID